MFRYHPEPVTSGSLASSDRICQCCGRARGYIYTGPVYAEEDLSDALCPWCIADGSAADRFAASFVDPAGVGDYGSWEEVPSDVIDHVARRTPGFTGWQQERWWTHCGDAAAFLGLAGQAELRADWAAAVPSIRADSQLDDTDWPAYLAALHRTQGPTAYVFQCLHCGALGGYSDCH
jgi:uncharacterized protein CbrC (UPF0167 family)